MVDKYKDTEIDLSGDDPFAPIIDTLRELPPENPSAVDRIVAAAFADKAMVREPKPIVSRRWWGIAAAVGISASTFILGFVLGHERPQAISSPMATTIDNGSTNASYDQTVSYVANAQANAQIESGMLPVPFRISTPAATTVSLVGDFNGWNPVATPLSPSADRSSWYTSIPLRAGRHTYAFMIDGQVVPDPNVPGIHDPDYDAIVSVVIVREP